MMIITDSDGDEHLIQGQQLNGLLTELRDLISMQWSEARRYQRAIDAAKVRSRKDGGTTRDDFGPAWNKMLEELAKEIEES